MQISSTFLKGFKSIFLLSLVTALISSCGDINTGPQTGEGHMNFYLTDAPGDFEEVNIDVQGLRIHYLSADTADTANGEWIDLPVDPMRLDLLKLTNGVDTLLSSVELDAGHYRELRLILGTDNDVVIDGETHDLMVPSGQQSGYKIKFNTELEDNEELDVTIDFDAARSVHKAGNSGKYILNPVLKAFVQDEEVGTITGTVMPLDADATVFAIMGDDTTGSTQPDDEGEFTLPGLGVGLYEISIKPANESYSDSTLTDVAVAEGEVNDIGVITLE